eukprot:scaffold310481_cov31-Tisochrysis_lutea.AAC.2
MIAPHSLLSEDLTPSSRPTPDPPHRSAHSKSALPKSRVDQRLVVPWLVAPLGCPNLSTLLSATIRRQARYADVHLQPSTLAGATWVHPTHSRSWGSVMGCSVRGAKQ